jgi:hypothetical protein
LTRSATTPASVRCEPLLERAEAGLAALVEADDFAVEQGRS